MSTINNAFQANFWTGIFRLVHRIGHSEPQIAHTFSFHDDTGTQQKIHLSTFFLVSFPIIFRFRPTRSGLPLGIV
jgi:hypothetical protein